MSRTCCGGLRRLRGRKRFLAQSIGRRRQPARCFSRKTARGCHSTWPHRWSEPRKEGMRFIENAIVSVDVIGTDPGQFTSPQFESQPTSRTGAMSPHLAAPYTDATLAPPPAVFSAVTDGVYYKALAALGLSEEERMSAHGYGPFDPEPLPPIPVLGGYKANPAEGMWAAPPYLHNGSVPNLYELLLPASERSKTFFIGREFDPVKVGIDTSGESGRFLYRHLPCREQQRGTLVRRGLRPGHHRTAAYR